MYQRLVEFYKEYGHCCVPGGYKDKQLAGWVNTQRTAYKKEKVAQDKIDLLNAIGFVWSIKNNT